MARQDDSGNLVFPPLPDAIMGPDGKVVPVLLVTKAPLRAEDSETYDHGEYDRQRDVIEINSNASLEDQWHTLHHEKFHLWCWKLGLTYALNPETLEDQVCQGLASAEMAQLRYLLGGDRATD